MYRSTVRSFSVVCDFRRLEHQGLIESEWGVSDNNRRAKYYRLTAAGRHRLGEEVASWNRLADAMALALGSTPQEICDERPVTR